ncbi:hypothetical protein O1611_g556 [Lasiodiplodia mahajangana]|uniref:Uncharacterized protein n=1 Tax=Lasiodiplodia mahajangana TaxID=1108764 RepID=A0ACC2K028_9PEZI|nr:hypothetical protein O1611_g556 [Lasiodiplodia mahajangana]
MDATEDVESAKAVVKPFRFLDLDVELRNKIYELLLVYCPLGGTKDDYDTPYSSCACGKPENLQLMLVNKQVREEAAAIFWSKNRLRFDTTRTFVRVIHDLDWKLRQKIKDVRIHPDPCAFIRRMSDCTSDGGKSRDASWRYHTRREYALDMYQMLRACRSLERLQVHDAAPQLKSLNITIFGQYDYFVAACLSKVGKPWKLLLRGHPIDLGKEGEGDTCYVGKRRAMLCGPVDDSCVSDAEDNEFYGKKSYIFKLPGKEVAVTVFTNKLTNPLDVSLSTWVERRHRTYGSHKRSEESQDGYFSD